MKLRCQKCSRQILEEDLDEESIQGLERLVKESKSDKSSSQRFKRKLPKSILEHTEGVNSVCVTADGRKIISAGAGTVKVWKMSTGECVSTIETSSSISSVCDS